MKGAACGKARSLLASCPQRVCVCAAQRLSAAVAEINELRAAHEQLRSVGALRTCHVAVVLA
jgi:hypothetical protein